VVREWGESLGIALVLALVLRHFVVEAFKIPTKSMEPTLVGDTASGDKILVSKFMYDFRKPERGDVIVFKYPEDPFKNFIKRLIGLPGEEIKIWGGDIYVNGKIWRKPSSVQHALWMPVTNDALIWDEIADASLRGFPKVGEMLDQSMPPSLADVENWQAKHRNEQKELVAKRRIEVWRPDTEDEWTSTDDGLRVKPGPGASQPSLVTYGEPKVYDRVLTATGQLKPVVKSGVDRYEHDRERAPELRTLAPVDDLSLRFRVTPNGATGKVVAVLEDSRRKFVAEIPVGEQAPVAIRISSKGEPEAKTVSGPEFALQQTKTARVVFQNVDDTVILEVNGTRLVYQEYPQVPDTERLPGARIGVAFGVSGVPATFTHVRLERDVCYWADLGSPWGFARSWTLGRQQYFVLGDNSPNSKDSRLWVKSPAVPEENLIGEAFMVFWPPKRIRIIR
jgi:signal peptidase I